MKKVFLIGIIIFLFTGIVYSNSGPPVIDPVDQSIMFNEHSGVSLIEEWVTIAFKEEYYRDSSELNLRTGNVSVKYMLKNLDDTEKNLEVLFISPTIDSSSIIIKRNGVEIQGLNVEKELEPPKNWGAKTPKEIIEPVSNKELYETPNNVVSPNYSFSGIGFKINFQPNEVVTLDISYKSPSGFYNFDKVASMVYSQIYYLTPAEFWEGNTKVNLRVEFPPGTKTKLYSNIPLSKPNSHIYEGNLDKIPDKEWVFTFVDSNRLIFGSNNRTLHNALVLLTLLIGVTSGIVLRRKNHKMYGIVLWLVSIAFLVYFIRLSYGSIFLLYLFGPFIALGLLVIFSVAAYKKSSRAAFARKP